MACVLTIALVEDDVRNVGHVGDSRLYLLQPGRITKMTHDHSPVGEREDRGELERRRSHAPRPPQRNLSRRRCGGARSRRPAFIEILRFPMPADGALLLCSDGLTDLISSARNPRRRRALCARSRTAVRALIEAANHAGGKDNVTVILVAAPDYRPSRQHHHAPPHPQT